MAVTVRATCPGCRGPLRIPAEWAGRPVKCRNCGAVVRSGGPTPKPEPAPHPLMPTPANETPAMSATVPTAVPTLIAYPYPPAANGYPTVAVPFHEPQLHFEASETTKKYRGPKPRSGKLLWVGVSLVLTVGLVAVALNWSRLSGPFQGLLGHAQVTVPTEPRVTAATPTGGAGGTSTLANASKRFPRRMLFLSVTKYLYCNTLAAGNSTNEDMVSIAARRLAYQWKVPMDKGNEQLFVLQDSGAKPRPMLKATVARAVESFCETSRDQDRVLIYFGGHAAELDGKAYLVPVDGEPADAATLLPLDDFWAKVKACPAQQKVVVFDVCRLNEDGDKLRPGSEPMTASLEKLLHAAPPGVQVVTTASAGANALEYRYAPPDAREEGGSLFLSTLIHLASKGKIKSPNELDPEEPLPVAPWFDAAKVRMKEVAGLSGKADPAPQLRGAPGAAPVASNAQEPPARHFDFAPAPRGLPIDEVARIVEPIRALPPYRGKLTKDDAVESLVPFSEEVMKAYRPDAVTAEAIQKDPERYAVRLAALQSLALIQKEWKSSVEGETELRTQILTGANDAFKKLIIREQETPARITEELETQITKVEKLMGRLDEEPSKYWRVMYVYALAQLKARLAFMSEYNLALGSIRTDNLPKVDEGKGQAGLVLVSTDKMKSKKEVKDLADSANELFTKIAEEHKGTPWAIQAKRHRALSLGLEWRPFTMGVSSKIE